MNGPRASVAVAVVALSGIAGAQSSPGPATCAATPESATVSGRVLGDGAAPASPTRVMARWSTGSSRLDSAETRSDANGAFRLCRLPRGIRVSMRAGSGNLESLPETIIVRAGEDSVRVELTLQAIEGDTGAAVASVPARPSAEPLNLAGARTISLERFRALHGRGIVVGVVTGAELGAPLPFADLLVEPHGAAGFTSNDGRFRFVNVPAGAIRIRARRIGSAPVTVSVTVRSGATDTVRIALPSIALRLSDVRVADAVCPGRARGAIDSSIVTVLEQVRMNSERASLLARQYPFEMVLQRVVANEGYDRALQNRRVLVDTVQVDTVTATLEHGWRYEPGALIRQGANTGNRKLGAPERMVIPQLVDFAEPAFLATHCFRYAGVVALDGARLLRVDVEPTRAVREPDVRGSLYFDTTSYQIRRTTLYVERPSPQKAGDFWVTRVDTWFRDLMPTLPVIERIAQRTTLRTATNPDAWPGQAATEYQRLIDVRFLSRPPSDR